MHIAIYVTIAAVFWSGILIGITYLMRKKNYFIKSFGIWNIVTLYLFCMLRMILPINTDFTIGIRTKGFLADIFDGIYFDKYRIGDYEVSIFDGLLALWIVVALILLLRFVYQYQDMCRMLRTIEETEDAQCKDVLQKVYESKGKRQKVTILKNDQIDMPMGIGIFKKRILLPEREYTDQELCYILLHEYTHFLNRDLVIKILVHIFCCIFWWNPIVYLLRKDLSQSLEIKCDLCITENLPKKETSDYLQTIIATLKSSGKKKKYPVLNDAVALGKGKKDEMVERFQYIIKNKKDKGRSKKAVIVWLSIVCVIWVVSYRFVFVPAYDPPIEDIVTDPGAVEVTSENSYIVYKNGKYELFINGKSNGEASKEGLEIYKSIGIEVRGE